MMEDPRYLRAMSEYQRHMAHAYAAKATAEEIAGRYKNAARCRERAKDYAEQSADYVEVAGNDMDRRNEDMQGLVGLPDVWRREVIEVPPAPNGSAAKSYNGALRSCADQLEAALTAAGVPELLARAERAEAELAALRARLELEDDDQVDGLTGEAK